MIFFSFLGVLMKVNEQQFENIYMILILGQISVCLLFFYFINKAFIRLWIFICFSSFTDCLVIWPNARAHMSGPPTTTILFTSFLPAITPSPNPPVTCSQSQLKILVTYYQAELLKSELKMRPFVVTRGKGKVNKKSSCLKLRDENS